MFRRKSKNEKPAPKKGNESRLLIVLLIVFAILAIGGLTAFNILNFLQPDASVSQTEADPTNVDEENGDEADPLNIIVDNDTEEEADPEPTATLDGEALQAQSAADEVCDTGLLLASEASSTMLGWMHDAGLEGISVVIETQCEGDNAAQVSGVAHINIQVDSAMNTAEMGDKLAQVIETLVVDREYDLQPERLNFVFSDGTNQIILYDITFKNIQSLQDLNLKGSTLIESLYQQ